MSGIGLSRGTVKVVAYDFSWPNEFEKERQQLIETFGEKILAIEHIGSTSIPGLAAKPIIDMTAAVNSFDELPLFINELQKLGYEYIAERMFNNRKFFPKGLREKRTHHLNIVIKDDYEQWIKPLAFRDYLRNHREAREKYEKLKTNLAKQYSDDRATYTQLKDDFFKSIFTKALS